jgi:hypothetical protein
MTHKISTLRNFLAAPLRLARMNIRLMMRLDDSFCASTLCDKCADRLQHAHAQSRPFERPLLRVFPPGCFPCASASRSSNGRASVSKMLNRKQEALEAAIYIHFIAIKVLLSVNNAIKSVNIKIIAGKRPLICPRFRLCTSVPPHFSYTVLLLHF